jgi:hypothetical protein
MQKASHAGSLHGQWQGCFPVNNSQVPNSQIYRPLVSSQALRSSGNSLPPRKQGGKESEDTGSLSLPHPWQGPLGSQEPWSRGKAVGPEEAVGRKRGGINDGDWALSGSLSTWLCHIGVPAQGL